MLPPAHSLALQKGTNPINRQNCESQRRTARHRHRGGRERFFPDCLGTPTYFLQACERTFLLGRNLSQCFGRLGTCYVRISTLLFLKGLCHCHFPITMSSVSNGRAQEE